MLAQERRGEPCTTNFWSAFFSLFFLFWLEEEPSSRNHQNEGTRDVL